ncbi:MULTISPECIES: TusE/DsrC/DsvC family sulfur relay protein [Pseudomonas]|uniref:Sulfurtransferase n=1 Tax=Pseudomonas segetis TaxID=298908 RepID=A0A239AJS7_9PSED|nr:MULTISPECIES: TusE/DsrC/DsvC family sulfur relay protein [Pseudomonas]SNR95780.1 tRNA 2-thiouridine synthesizing protein E [Pseudomonas segetis]
MSELTVAGQIIALDKDGYLCKLDDWSEAVAAALAQREALILTEEHWQVLKLLREFYAEFQLSPANRPLIKYVALKLGPEQGNSLHLNRLFNGTPAKLAAKLAGLPKPTNCL